MLLAWGRGAYALDPALDVSQYAHTAWKIRDGFTQGFISCIAQTPDGYLWLGTESGLYRFDGARSLPWQPPPGQHLPSNYIQALLVGRDGTLWITTNKGLASWKDGKLTNYPEAAEQRFFPVLQDREGTIWFGAYSPGRLCAIQGGKLHCYGAGSFGSSVIALYEDGKGNLWTSSGTGVWRWKPGPPEQYAFPRGVVEVNSFSEDDNGTLLLATNDGVKQIVGGKIESYALPRVTGTFRPNTLFRSSDGALWVGTQQGLLHLHNRRIDAFGAADSLSGDFVTSIFEDREGNIWVSTLGGLDRFREYAVPRISRNQGLSNNNAYSVQATQDGAIWIGTPSGLNRWANGHVTVYGWRGASAQGGSTGEQELSIGGAVTNIANSGLTGTPRSLGQDDQARLWVSTSDGVFYLDGARFARIATFQGRNTVPGIVGDGHGNVWIGDAILGLSHLTPGNAQPVPWSQLGQRNFGAQAFLPDRSGGGLWLGFLEGGIAYFKGGQVRASYTAADGLGRGRVDDLRFGSHEALWAATEGGLSRIRDGRIQTLTSKNGLPCDQVHWSIEDDDHFVWIYTSCGLVRTAQSELDAWVNDPKRVIETRVFDASNGVRSLAVYGGYGPHMTKSPDGKIWFVAYDGVSVIDPRHLPVNKIPPPVHIEQITADHKTYWQNWTSNASTSPPKLPPLVRDLTIDYTALSLVVPEKVRFRYKLEGWDRDWQDAGTRRQAFYMNLAPRKYRFRVMACNNSGVWNEAGDTLDFSIAPAYWQTNWFRALCVLAFLAMLGTVYRLRVRSLERRQVLLERNQALLERNQQLLERHQSEIGALNERLMKAQEEERVRIAGELHDGVLQKITSLAILLGMATLELPADSEPKAEVKEVEKKLIEVGTEIRQLSHELHPAVLQEAGLPAALSSYCEEFSATRGLPIDYQADESVEELSPGAALCIYRIAQEALGNVAKHARAKQVEVRLTRSDSRVCLVVSDDGVGFNPEGSGKAGGLGLINMRERVRQLGGTFAFESKPGHGTTVKAEVPFRPAS